MKRIACALFMVIMTATVAFGLTFGSNRPTVVIQVAVPGPQGPPGPAQYKPRGTWSPFANYSVNHQVNYNGASYVALLPSTGFTPQESFAWTLLAAKGDKGETGAKGDKGDRGLTGAIGPTGPQGPEGQTGPQGPVGPKGTIGNPGYTPVKNIDYFDGSIGPQGATGPRGPAGPEGPKGDKGDVGAPGAVGPQGPAGLQGPKGDKGDPGALGPAGPQGIQGADGVQGPQGPQGATGPAGPNTVTPATTTTITGLIKGTGTNMGQAVAGTDYLAPNGSAAGLTNFPPVTPTAHKLSHATGGSDALTASDVGAIPASPQWKAVSGASPGYTGTPTIATMPNGKLLAVWREGATEYTTDGVLKGAIGDTWDTMGTPFTIHDTVGVNEANPAVLVDGSRIYLFHAHRIVADSDVETYMTYSDDNAATWSAEVRVDTGSVDSWTRTNGIKLSNGSLLLPKYHGANSSSWSSYFLKCTGTCGTASNWIPKGNITNGASGGIAPSVIEVEPGHLLAYMRTVFSGILKSESTDYGETWSAPQTVSGITSTNNPTAMVKLGNGGAALLLDDGDNTKVRRRFGEGSTRDNQWAGDLVIEHTTASPGNVRYPAVAQYGNNIAYVWMWGAGAAGTSTEIHIWGEPAPAVTPYVPAITTTASLADSSNKRFVTDAQRAVIQNTSGVNTGDQDLSGLVPKTTTINTKPLSSNIIFTQDDVADGVTNKAYTATEKNKLAGIAGGANVTLNGSETLSNKTLTAPIVSILKPASDSAVAIQVTKADGTTPVINIDTANKRMGMGTTTPTRDIEVVGFDATGSGQSSLTTGTRMRTVQNNANAGGGFGAYADRLNGTLPFNGDRIGYLIFGSYATGADKNAAAFKVLADGSDWTQTSLPAAFVFENADGGTTARNDNLHIAASGNVGFNNASPSALAHVKARTTVRGSKYTAAGNTALSATGSYTGSQPGVDTYTITVQSNGTPDTFVWHKNSDSDSAPINMTTGFTSLTDGLSVAFTQTTGHIVGAKWIATAPTSGSFSGANYINTSLRDFSSSGTYTGPGGDTYTVVIDAVSTPDTFKWKKNSGSYTTGVAITGSNQLLSDGVNAKFTATTGHTLGDQWVISMPPPFAVDDAAGTRLVTVDNNGNLSSSGTLDGKINLTVTTATSNTVESPEIITGMWLNNTATAGAAVSYALPTAAAGKGPRCYRNYTGKTGTLTIQTSAAGQYIDVDGANTASGGYVTSGGSLGDSACFVGVDSTHWLMLTTKGAWTVH